MRLPCLLRVHRGDRKLRDLADQAGINAGDLSRIERGIMLPSDELVPALEDAYGVPWGLWYAPELQTLVLADDESLA